MGVDCISVVVEEIYEIVHSPWTIDWQPSTLIHSRLLQHKPRLCFRISNNLSHISQQLLGIIHYSILNGVLHSPYTNDLVVIGKLDGTRTVEHLKVL
jgi:hypothetical protein